MKVSRWSMLSSFALVVSLLLPGAALAQTYSFGQGASPYGVSRDANVEIPPSETVQQTIDSLWEDDAQAFLPPTNDAALYASLSKIPRVQRLIQKVSQGTEEEKRLLRTGLLAACDQLSKLAYPEEDEGVLEPGKRSILRVEMTGAVALPFLLLESGVDRATVLGCTARIADRVRRAYDLLMGKDDASPVHKQERVVTRAVAVCAFVADDAFDQLTDRRKSSPENFSAAQAAVLERYALVCKRAQEWRASNSLPDAGQKAIRDAALYADFPVAYADHVLQLAAQYPPTHMGMLLTKDYRELLSVELPQVGDLLVAFDTSQPLPAPIHSAVVQATNGGAVSSYREKADLYGVYSWNGCPPVVRYFWRK